MVHNLFAFNFGEILFKESSKARQRFWTTAQIETWRVSVLCASSCWLRWTERSGHKLSSSASDTVSSCVALASRSHKKNTTYSFNELWELVTLPRWIAWPWRKNGDSGQQPQTSPVRWRPKIHLKMFDRLWKLWLCLEVGDQCGLGSKVRNLDIWQEGPSRNWNDKAVMHRHADFVGLVWCYWLCRFDFKGTPQAGSN